MSFTRRSLGNASVRTASHYRGTAIVRGCPAHAPTIRRMRRELYEAVGPDEGITDPIKRAMSKLANAEALISEMFAGCAAEAREIEAAIRMEVTDRED